MRRLALRGSLRQWLTRLHRWSGLVVMLLLLIASVLVVLNATGLSVWWVKWRMRRRAARRRHGTPRPAAA